MVSEDRPFSGFSKAKTALDGVCKLNRGSRAGTWQNAIAPIHTAGTGLCYRKREIFDACELSTHPTAHEPMRPTRTQRAAERSN